MWERGKNFNMQSYRPKNGFQLNSSNVDSILRKATDKLNAVGPGDEPLIYMYCSRCRRPHYFDSKTDEQCLGLKRKEAKN